MFQQQWFIEGIVSSFPKVSNHYYSTKPKDFEVSTFKMSDLICKYTFWSMLSLTHFSVALCFQASTPYSLESESLRMDCIMSGGASPTLAIGAANNKVRHIVRKVGRVWFCQSKFKKNRIVQMWKRKEHHKGLRTTLQVQKDGFCLMCGTSWLVNNQLVKRIWESELKWIICEQKKETFLARQSYYPDIHLNWWLKIGWIV